MASIRSGAAAGLSIKLEKPRYLQNLCTSLCELHLLSLFLLETRKSSPFISLSVPDKSRQEWASWKLSRSSRKLDVHRCFSFPTVETMELVEFYLAVYLFAK